MNKISIVTVCKNSEKYISDCIESVIAQMNADYEYIIIDGNSTDLTTDIIKKYQNNIDYWISESDKNIAEAFNKGIKKTTGKWILFLNSDDYLIDKNIISKVQEILLNSDEDVVFGKINQIVEGNTEEIQNSHLYGSPWKWSKYRYLSTLPHPACFTNRQYFEQYGFFDEKYTNALDYELYLRKGKLLRTKFIDLTVSNMRLGGMSNKYAYESLKQSMNAQIKNNSLPHILSYLNWYYLTIRLRIKKLIY